MRFKKITFTQEKPKLVFGEKELMKLYQSEIFKVELIEISEVISPSGMNIIFKENGQRKMTQLYKHRTEFLFQNGVFIWDTRKMDFAFDTNKVQNFHDSPAYIEVECETDFKLEMYCVILQPNEK